MVVTSVMVEKRGEKAGFEMYFVMIFCFYQREGTLRYTERAC